MRFFIIKKSYILFQADFITVKGNLKCSLNVMTKIVHTSDNLCFVLSRFYFWKKKCTRFDIVTIFFHIKGNNLKVWICIRTVSRGILLINKLKCKGFLHIYVYLCSATKRSNKLLTAYKFTLGGDVVMVCCTPYNIWILFHQKSDSLADFGQLAESQVGSLWGKFSLHVFSIGNEITKNIRVWLVSLRGILSTYTRTRHRHALSV